MTKELIQNEGLEKIKADFQYLVSLFKEMLSGIGEGDLAEALPFDSAAIPEKKGGSDEKLTQAIGICFELLNLAEENAATHYRRKVETKFGIESTRGSWGETLHRWKTAGTGEREIAEMLREMKVVPVLTAHPTEAKRLTVLDIHRELYLLLVKKENPNWSAAERSGLKREIIGLMERWWRTGEIFLQKPSLEDERNNLMHYFVNVFPESVRLTDQRLQDAWDTMGFSPELLEWPEHFPLIQFGSWVGGDRDGHPFVTPEFTASTLRLHRQAALKMLRNQLNDLAAKLSFSSYRNSFPKEFLDEIQSKAALLGEKGQEALQGILETGPNAPFLGEVALVPHSSPISQLGLVFLNTLYDENASCHLALGTAYRVSLEGGSDMSEQEFMAAGGNESLVHVDFMFGSGEMDVDGVLEDGTIEPVMRKGEWAFE